MAPPIPIPIIVFLLVLSAVSSSSLPPETEDGIQIVFAERVIHLTGPIARVILTLDVENAAAADSHASQVLLAFTPWEVEHLAIVKATTVDGKHNSRNKASEVEKPLSVVQASSHLPATKNLYSVVLTTHLKPGEKTTLQVVYVLTDVLDPSPAKAVSPSSSSQLVSYHDSAVLLSPYHVREQVTYIKTPGNMIQWSTKVDPTSTAGAEVKYGVYYEQEPGTFSPISLQYENRPFVVFEKIERKVDIPLWGQIKVTDRYKMAQESAWYQRIFSFFDKDERMFSRPECPRIWPTPHEFLSSNKDRLYLKLQQGPTYSWDYCTFTVGYGSREDYSLSQSEDGRLYYINLTFGVPKLLDTVVNDFTTVVLLPEGSKNPQPIFSFPMEATSKQTYLQRFWALLQHHDAKAPLAGRAIEMQTGYSYVAGRATVVLKKKKLVAEHNVPFQVYYESNPILTRINPLTLILLLFMGACLISYLICYESSPILMLMKPLNVFSMRTLKEAFLAELEGLAGTCSGLWMICGDFNLMYQAQDKNNDRLNRRLMQRFRRTIDTLQLAELHLQPPL